jgi:DNA invertase Pin-like site-specific DNA recombinase
MSTATRAGLYQRVSDDKAGQSRSVAQQDAAGQAAASRYGWKVVKIYSEAGSASASRYARRDRPKWEQLRSDVRAGRLDIVILWEPSRGSRKLADWSEFLDDCRAAHCKVYVTAYDHLYDLENARDWRSLAEDGIDSGFESEKNSLRSKRGHAGAVAEGKPMGRIPYGYARRYDPVTRQAEQYPNPDTAPVVREVIGRIAASEPVSKIVAGLSGRGIPSPTGRERWARSSVTALVLNGVVYIGKRRHNGGPLLDGNWPALVDEDVYWAAVNVLRDPARKSAADGRGGVRPGAAKWLLSYVARCGKCGAPLNVTSRIVRRERVHYYRCSSSRGGCAVAPVEWMDSLVTAAIVRWCARPGVYEAITGGDDREAVAAREEAAAERARLADFEAQAVAGSIRPESFARIAAGIEGRIAELEQRATHLTAPPALRDLLAATPRDAGREAREADIADRWAEMPLASRRHVVSVLAKPTLRPSGRKPGVVLDEFRVSMNLRDAA